jgi:hypothetical protein
MTIAWPTGKRLVVAYAISALIVVLTGEAIRWAHARHVSTRTQENHPVSTATGTAPEASRSTTATETADNGLRWGAGTGHRSTGANTATPPTSEVEEETSQQERVGVHAKVGAKITRAPGLQATVKRAEGTSNDSVKSASPQKPVTQVIPPPRGEPSVAIAIAVGDDRTRNVRYPYNPNGSWEDDVRHCVSPLRCYEEGAVSYPIELDVGEKGWARVFYVVFNTSEVTIQHPTVYVIAALGQKVNIATMDQRPGGTKH